MYFLIEIPTCDAKIAGKAVYEYASEILAVASFHTRLGNAMKSDLYESELCIVIDSNGSVIKREKYLKPAPEKSPDEDATVSPAPIEPDIEDDTESGAENH